jgi:hypothetical protein
MTRIRVDKRASARLTFQWYRSTLGWRAAYWFVVARYGWKEWRHASV